MATATKKVNAARPDARDARDRSESAPLQARDDFDGDRRSDEGGSASSEGVAEWPGVAIIAARDPCDHERMRPEGRRGAAARDPARTGAGDGPIEIVEYDPSWPASYDAERERLAPLMPGVRIHHIGSTAVPGLAAKAVIDMIALVDDLDSNTAAPIEQAGYQLPARFNVNLVHRRFLCYPTATDRTHHLHLVDEREDMNRCLRFRDSLRASPKLAAGYAALKRALATRYREDREGYTKAKSTFINDADAHAGSPAKPAS
jgi:GrpB-like predicted nucleotidyltransferase (UPF0157 family)